MARATATPPRARRASFTPPIVGLTSRIGQGTVILWLAVGLAACSGQEGKPASSIAQDGAMAAIRTDGGAESSSGQDGAVPMIGSEDGGAFVGVGRDSGPVRRADAATTTAPMSCDRAATAACGSDTSQYCDESSVCRACAPGLFNCNLRGGCDCDRACSGTECGGATCTPSDIGVCSDREFCNHAGECMRCDAFGGDNKNCNQTGNCECAGECRDGRCISGCIERSGECP